MKLSNKVALVTGSTSGIGAATAMALAVEGAHVIVSGRNRQRGEKVIDTISAAGGSAEFIPVELNGASSSLALAEARCGHERRNPDHGHARSRHIVDFQ
jgi:NAD(P)-dependent dehydrogenase (short-subunit alcohol dehydrogenase family)